MSGQEYSRYQVGPSLWAVRRACSECDGDGCDACENGVETSYEDEKYECSRSYGGDGDGDGDGYGGVGQ